MADADCWVTVGIFVYHVLLSRLEGWFGAHGLHGRGENPSNSLIKVKVAALTVGVPQGEPPEPWQH